MGWLQSLLYPFKTLWNRIQLTRTRHRKRMYFDHCFEDRLLYVRYDGVLNLLLMFGLYFGLFVGKGLYVLYEDVKCCSCEDVQILWSMLVGPEAGLRI